MTTVQWGKRFGRKGHAGYVSTDGRWILVQETYQYKPNNSVKSRTVVDWKVKDRAVVVQTGFDRDVVAKADTKKLCLERFYKKLSSVV